MTTDPFDRLTRRLAITQPRRFALGAGIAALAMTATDIDAKKKRRKKRKKKKKNQVSSCAKLCGFNCNKCLFRADGSPLCGDGVKTSCQNCSSDDNCGLAEPFCISHFEDREAGFVTTMCGEGSECACDPAALGVCADVFVCGVV